MPQVVQIPTHRPSAREDRPARLYFSTAEKYEQLVDEVIKCWQTGRCVLSIQSLPRLEPAGSLFWMLALGVPFHEQTGLVGCRVVVSCVPVRSCGPGKGDAAMFPCHHVPTGRS